MGCLGLGLALLALSAGHVAFAKFSIQEAEVRILEPVTPDKVMVMAMADFGKPRYGATLRGKLFDPEGMDATCDLTSCKYGCTSFSTSVPPIKLPRQAGSLNIMLLERGPSGQGQNPCLFVDKVYNAQLAGADAVLVVNDVDDDLSTLIAPKDEGTARELDELNIPAAMIKKWDGARLREFLSNGQEVLLQLSWAKSVPDASVVSWEFWTSTLDGCGSYCKQINDFTKAMKMQAQILEKSNLTTFTPRYFLYNCKEGSLDTTTCKADCYYNDNNVTFCGDSGVQNCTGKQVLEMNVRAACFHKLAAEAGKGWLWWDYATQLNDKCSVGANKYNIACVNEIFTSLNGTSLPGGQQAWDECSKIQDHDIPTILEETLVSMKGNDTLNISAIGLLPSIRINGAQFRGSLELRTVLRALCTGFEDGQEPPVCNSDGVSEDECQPGGEGYKACKLDDPSLGWRVRCVNTFSGYNCVCNSGMQMFKDLDTGDQRCEDVNECLATSVPYKDDKCACDRCACINKVGSYTCTGPLENKCTKEQNFGGCWHETINGTEYNACIDTFPSYKDRAAKGLVNDSSSWTMCECPRCFEAVQGGCKPKCDLRRCNMFSGVCYPDGDDERPADDGKSGGGGAATKSSGGATFGFLMLVAVGSALLTGIVVMAAQRHMMRQRMGDEIRDMMAQYMPLEERERNAMLAANRRPRGPGGQIRPDEESDEEGHGGTYGWHAAKPAQHPAAQGPVSTGPKLNVAAGGGAGPRSRGAVMWGPPPEAAAGAAALPSASSATAAAKGVAFGAAAASVARPAVDVFTVSGPESGRPPLPPFGSAAAAGASRSDTAGADPLLGLDLACSSSLDDQPAAAKGSGGSGSGSGPKSADNPFL